MSSAAASNFLLVLFSLLYLLIIGDCVSTYLCLTTISDTYRVWEGNLISAWLFELVGLVPGLVLFALVKAVGLVWLYRLAMKSERRYIWIVSMMSVAFCITAYANFNNWRILHLMGGM